MSNAVRNISPVKHTVDTNMSIIILCTSSALTPVTDRCNLISYECGVFNKIFHKPQIVMVCGQNAANVMNNSPNNIVKVENEYYDSSNTVRNIGIGLRATVNDRVIVICEDLFFNSETFKNLRLEHSSIVIDNNQSFKIDDIGCNINQGGFAEQLFYELPNKWAKILYLTGNELQLMRKIAWNSDNKNWFGFEAINKIIEMGGSFYCEIPKKMKISKV